MLHYGYLTPKLSKVSLDETEIIKDDLDHLLKVTELGYELAKAKLAYDFGEPDNTFGQCQEIRDDAIFMRWVIFYHLGTQLLGGGE